MIVSNAVTDEVVADRPDKLYCAATKFFW